MTKKKYPNLLQALCTPVISSKEKEKGKMPREKKNKYNMKVGDIIITYAWWYYEDDKEEERTIRLSGEVTEICYPRLRDCDFLYKDTPEAEDTHMGFFELFTPVTTIGGKVIFAPPNMDIIYRSGIEEGKEAANGKENDAS